MTDRMAKGWKRAFDDPIDLPGGRKLVTLEDAGNHITKLPKAEHSAPEWQDAMEALMLVATRGGPTMLRTSASCERCTGMRSVCSLLAAKTTIGASGN